MAIYAKIKGQKQGSIAGGASAAGHVDEILIDACEIDVVSPHDVASGLASGRRQWRPIHLTKPLDKSTPLLYQALITNEVLTSVVITYWRTGKDGKLDNFVTITLTNAMISEYHHLAGTDGNAVEKLSLTFTKFDFTWTDGGITAADDWMSPT
jgi:type VI secretion system secreted protein Hcp